MIIKEHCDPSLWRTFVLDHPEGSAFYLPEMAELFNSHKNYESVSVFALKDDKIIGLLTGVILREKGILSGVSSRTIVMGGPLVTGNSNAVAQQLLEVFTRIVSKRSVFTQFRILPDTIIDEEVFNNYGYKREDHLEIVVDLTLSRDDLWKGVNSKRRNTIRLAERCGSVVREIKTTSEAYEAFSIIEELYSTRKLPFPGIEFFKKSYEILGQTGYLRIYGTFNGEQLIAAMLILCFRDRMYNWYAGSKSGTNHFKPNDILPWEVFLQGKGDGYRSFIFGGAGHPDREYGVREYKKKFGGKIINPGRFNRINRPLIYRISVVGFRLWQMIR